MKHTICLVAVTILFSGCKQDDQNAQPQAPKPFTNSIGMELVYIPPGEFMMGSPSNESPIGADEIPQHRVKITEGFYMGMTEVTQSQYKAVTNTNPSHFKGKNNPVEKISWDDAVEFCRRLSEKEERTYRLPTEAEWEYACRGGTTTPFHTGGTISTSQANYDGNHVYGNGAKGTFREGTVPVRSFSPNAFGLYDMHGNVWEWCQDFYGENYYAESSTSDPQGPSSGRYRVLRGGNWLNGPLASRSARRHRSTPDFRSTADYGFRVVLEVR